MLTEVIRSATIDDVDKLRDSKTGGALEHLACVFQILVHQLGVVLVYLDDHLSTLAIFVVVLEG